MALLTDLILNLSAPFKLGTTHHGVGLVHLVRINWALIRILIFTLSYAYQFSVGNGRLGLGISGSFINREVESLNGVFPMILHLRSDEDVPMGNQNEFAFDLGAGLVLLYR